MASLVQATIRSSPNVYGQDMSNRDRGPVISRTLSRITVSLTYKKKGVKAAQPETMIWSSPQIFPQKLMLAGIASQL